MKAKLCRIIQNEFPFFRYACDEAVCFLFKHNRLSVFTIYLYPVWLDCVCFCVCMLHGSTEEFNLIESNCVCHVPTVRKCPFRASSRGPLWYLVREPGDIWRPMECASGTLFDKIKCTCVHQASKCRFKRLQLKLRALTFDGDHTRTIFSPTLM